MAESMVMSVETTTVKEDKLTNGGKKVKYKRSKRKHISKKVKMRGCDDIPYRDSRCKHGGVPVTRSGHGPHITHVTATAACPPPLSPSSPLDTRGQIEQTTADINVMQKSCDLMCSFCDKTGHSAVECLNNGYSGNNILPEGNYYEHHNEETGEGKYSFAEDLEFTALKFDMEIPGQTKSSCNNEQSFRMEHCSVPRPSVAPTSMAMTATLMLLLLLILLIQVMSCLFDIIGNFTKTAVNFMFAKFWENWKQPSTRVSHSTGNIIKIAKEINTQNQASVISNVSEICTPHDISVKSTNVQLPQVPSIMSAVILNGNVRYEMEIDTAAALCVISYNLFKEIVAKSEEPLSLETGSVTMRMADGTSSKSVKGMTYMRITRVEDTNKTGIFPVIVVEGPHALLGRPALLKLWPEYFRNWANTAKRSLAMDSFSVCQNNDACEDTNGDVTVSQGECTPLSGRTQAHVGRPSPSITTNNASVTGRYSQIAQHTIPCHYT